VPTTLQILYPSNPYASPSTTMIFGATSGIPRKPRHRTPFFSPREPSSPIHLPQCSHTYECSTRYKLAASGLVTVRSNISYDADFFTGITGSLTVNLNKNVKEKSMIFNVEVLSSSVETRTRTHICFADSGPNRGLTIYVRAFSLYPSEDSLTGCNRPPKRWTLTNPCQ
jgi:hypothetical protein